MRVYIVWAGEYSDRCIVQLTFDKKKAEMLCAANNEHSLYGGSYVEEYDVEDEIES